MSKTAFALLAVGSVVAQWIGLYLLPLTAGLTRPTVTVAAATAFLIGLGCLARLIAGGVQLGIALPALSIAMPLGGIAIGVFFFGEAVSPTKLIALFAAAGLVGYAASI